MRPTKITATVLTASMLLGIVSMAGCSKDETVETDANGNVIVVPDEDSVVIEEESDWYSTERMNVADAYYSGDVEYSYVTYRFLGTMGDEYCCEVSSGEVMPPDFNWETDNYRDYYHEDVITVNSDGDITSRMDLYELIDPDSEWISQAYIFGDTLKVAIASWGENITPDMYMVDVNLGAGEASERIRIDTPSNPDSFGNGGELLCVGDKLIQPFYRHDSNIRKYTCNLVITDANNNTEIVDMGQYLPDMNINYLTNAYEYGDNGMLLVTADNNYNQSYIKYDRAADTMTDLCPDGTEWLGDYRALEMRGINGRFFVVTKGVIKEIDFENHEITDAFDFNNCNINRYDITDCQLVDFTDDRIILTTTIWKENQWLDENSDYYFYTLNRCDENPNVGKAVIELACINGMTRQIADAVYNYNESNDNFFIRYDSSYDVRDSIDMLSYEMGLMSPEEAESQLEEASINLSNQMAMDLLSGDGPDIIIDGFGYGQLNNENYLMDLSDYMTELDSEAYFSNVFDGARVDGSMYQLPLSFTINGIMVDGAHVDAGQIGFTFDQYREFVDNECNGKDPINQRQLQYFNTCINSMSDLFADGDGLNYDNEAFRELANYVNDNVFNRIRMDEMMYEDPDVHGWYVPLGGFNQYICLNEESKLREMRFLGLPSADGRGPSINIQNSVGISAQTLNPDGCWSFIRTLLGEEVQSGIARRWAFPVNRTAYETTANEMLSRYNAMLTGEINYSMSGMGLEGSEINDAIIQGLADNCIEISHVSIVDPTISVIISEEIQPFLAGDKSIDEILVILQDRVDTVLAERQ